MRMDINQRCPEDWQSAFPEETRKLCCFLCFDRIFMSRFAKHFLWINILFIWLTVKANNRYPYFHVQKACCISCVLLLWQRTIYVMAGHSPDFLPYSSGVWTLTWVSLDKNQGDSRAAFLLGTLQGHPCSYFFQLPGAPRVSDQWSPFHVHCQQHAFHSLSKSALLNCRPFQRIMGLEGAQVVQGNLLIWRTAG